MREPMNGKRGATCLGIIAGLIGVLLCMSGVDAKSSSTKSSSAPPPAVAKAAACDYHTKPTITTVRPDRARPGQKITINGKNFGTKECFHSVSFGARSAKEFTYVSPTTLEVTVPNLLPGSVPVTVSTEAGTSQLNLEIQAK
jgi:hypothetical protein